MAWERSVQRFVFSLHHHALLWASRLEGIGFTSRLLHAQCIFFIAILLTGTLSYIIYIVPIEAGMSVFVWIGVTIFIQAFSAAPTKHYPAVAIGMLPVAGGFSALVIRHALAGVGITFSPELLDKNYSQSKLLNHRCFCHRLRIYFHVCRMGGCNRGHRRTPISPGCTMDGSRGRILGTGFYPQLQDNHLRRHHCDPACLELDLGLLDHGRHILLGTLSVQAR